MADVKQAAEWLKKGLTVRDPTGFRMRTAGEGTDVVFLVNRISGKVEEDAAEVYVSDLLSDGWELAE